MSYVGTAFIIVGFLLIIFSFALGYGMYNSLRQLQITQQTPQINGSNLNSSFNQLATNISLSINNPIYYIIEIIILFLFASIGYKIADLGIRTNSISNKDYSSEKIEKSNKNIKNKQE